MFSFEEVDESRKFYMDHEEMPYLEALAQAIRDQFRQWGFVLQVEGREDEDIQAEIQAEYERFLKELEKRGIQYDGRHTQPRKEDDPFEIAKSLEIDGLAIHGSIMRYFQRDWYTFTPTISGEVKFEVMNLDLEQSIMIFLIGSDGSTELNFGSNYLQKSIEFSHTLTARTTYFLKIVPSEFGKGRPINYSLVVSYE